MKYDGEWIYLVPMENAPGRVDSVKITNASFSFSGKGEEMRVLRLRHLLRIYIQELLVVTEPGTIHVKADSVGSVTGTPQNDALQKWKEGREKKQEAYHFIRTGLRNATGKDSLHLIRIRDSLRMQEQETNFLFLKEQGNPFHSFLPYQNLVGRLMEYSFSISLVSCMKLSLAVLNTSSMRLCFSIRLIHIPDMSRRM